MTRALFPLIRAWKVVILRWAAKELTRHQPTHPDLPKVLLALHFWENARG